VVEESVRECQPDTVSVARCYPRRMLSDITGGYPEISGVDKSRSVGIQLERRVRAPGALFKLLKGARRGRGSWWRSYYQ